MESINVQLTGRLVDGVFILDFVTLSGREYKPDSDEAKKLLKVVKSKKATEQKPE